MGLSWLDMILITGKSLTGNWVRSSLTTLGVFMGVAAVSATLNIQTITSQQIEDKLAQRDKPFVAPNGWIENVGQIKFREDDYQAMKKAIPEVRTISTLSYLWSLEPVQSYSQEASKVQTLSVSLNYLDTTGRRMLKGRFFNQTDFDQYSPVTVIDEQLAETLFGRGDPRNQTIYAGGNRLLVIGVMESKSERPDSKNQGMLWVTQTMSRILQSSEPWTELRIGTYRLEDIRPLKLKLKKFLEQRYPKAEVWIWDGRAEDLLKEKETLAIASRSLTVVGLIALAIGGIGIANITIASVLERTQEIGLRRAIGATELDIMAQFILEAVLLSCVGGLAAIGTVHGLTQLVTTTIVLAPYQFSIQNASLAMVSAVLVGVGSSFFPALRATHIDIVEALRSE